METDPHVGDIVPLAKQLAAFRRRVGNWRLFFDLDPTRHLVEVRAIERRTSTTYRKR
jgi:mRNA-degrading endonuclease RelE of RelBE toxin-antitoxin system